MTPRSARRIFYHKGHEERLVARKAREKSFMSFMVAFFLRELRVSVVKTFGAFAAQPAV
jgi:hypothetical protein